MKELPGQFNDPLIEAPAKDYRAEERQARERMFKARNEIYLIDMKNKIRQEDKEKKRQ